jgi:hypothetical protein
MMQGLQNLLASQMTLVPMALEQTNQEQRRMQVEQLRLVLTRLVGEQKQVLTMQGLQSLLEDGIESVLMKLGLKRLEQMKLEVLGQSLLYDQRLPVPTRLEQVLKKPVD